MLRTLYLYRNITRNLLRTLLTCAAVAFPITVYVLSTAVVDGIERFLDNSARSLRLAVTHKASVVNPLPEAYLAKIQSLDPTRTRIISVCGMRWIGGKIPGNKRPLSVLAADMDSFHATFPEYNLTSEELDAWQRDRRALIAGYGTAGQFGWKAGDRITIQPSVPPYTPMEFRVISIAPDAHDPVTLWCRRDYVEEEIKRFGAPEGLISFAFVKCATQEDLNRFRVAIDELFARSPDETKTQDEKSFMSNFITQQFDLPRNLTILSWVTVFVAVMAAANTMSMNFRDRTNELAVLKSLGFSGWLVFSQIQLESLLLSLTGGLIGALGPYVAFTYTPLRDFTVPLIQHLEVKPIVCAEALLISLCIGVTAAAWPSWRALRMTVVSALRNME